MQSCNFAKKIMILLNTLSMIMVMMMVVMMMAAATALILTMIMMKIMIMMKSDPGLEKGGDRGEGGKCCNNKPCTQSLSSSFTLSYLSHLLS